MDNPEIARLLARTAHPRRWVRVRAVIALGLRGGPAVEALVQSLDAADPDVQRLAAEALGKLRDQRALGPLLGVVRSAAPRRPEVRATAALALSRLAEGFPTPELRALIPLLRSLMGSSPSLARMYWIAIRRIEAGGDLPMDLPLPAAAPQSAIGSLPLPSSGVDHDPDTLPRVAEPEEAGE